MACPAKQTTSLKRVRRAVKLQRESNWLQQAIDRAAKQINSWPDWKRSLDQNAIERK